MRGRRRERESEGGGGREGREWRLEGRRGGREAFVLPLSLLNWTLLTGAQKAAAVL